jgi:poly(A) polymerase/tRNA nucleotidyltransferase (CCA-adding enzyme)
MIPEYLFDLCKTIKYSGYESYLVGGSVRNILLNVQPKDFDITTNALPDEIAKIFPKSILTGAKFGTVTVLYEDKNSIQHSVEITTYRLEKEYFGGRWPTEVFFTRNLEDDLKRRDFTVNAFALDLNKICFENQDIKSIKSNLIDLFEGLDDLQNKIIRAVGNPIDRFREDGLRSLRACRLASVYGFEIEEKTFEAMKETWEVAAQVSMERARDEFVKLILNSPKPSLGIELMRKAGLLKLYIPELLEGYGIEQNKYHVHDIYQHALDTVDVAPSEVRLAALFHDIGKARTKEGEHFYGHDRVGAQMTREIMKRLKFSNKEIEDTVNLVRWHMFYVPNQVKPVSGKEIELSFGDKSFSQRLLKEKEERIKKFKEGWSDNAVRRLIIRVGGHEQIDKLIKLRIADAVANPKASFDPSDIQLLASKIAEIREKESLLSIKDLKISGHDLKELGIPEGPEMKKILEKLLEMVIDDIELNTKENLLLEAKKIMNF